MFADSQYKANAGGKKHGKIRSADEHRTRSINTIWFHLMSSQNKAASCFQPQFGLIRSIMNVGAVLTCIRRPQLCTQTSETAGLTLQGLPDCHCDATQRRQCVCVSL